MLALAACSDTVSWYKADVEIGDTGGEMSYYCEEITLYQKTPTKLFILFDTAITN